MKKDVLLDLIFLTQQEFSVSFSLSLIIMKGVNSI